MTFSLQNIPSRTGQTAIVTGANTGLGFETALAFAGKGLHVVMACRTESRARDAIGRIEERVPGAGLEFIRIDLTDLASVRAFARHFRATHARLDLLVNNAGIMMPPYSRTADGFESQMSANYFGHFLLTSLLLDAMPDRPSSRVVTLSSNAHKMGRKRIVFEDLHFERRYRALDAYAQSKLACLMFARALDGELKARGKSIVAASAHPGASDTELGRFAPPVLAALLRATVLPMLSHRPTKAALPQIRAALDDDVQGGDYFGPTGFLELKGPPGRVRPMAYALDEGQQRRLWEVSSELTGAVFPWE